MFVMISNSLLRCSCLFTQIFKKILFFTWIVQIEWYFIYVIQRVFGGTAEKNVSNADDSTTECNKIFPITYHDTQTPSKPSKVMLTASTSTSTQLNYMTMPKPSLIDDRRGNWWIGLRTMFSRVGTSLRTRRRNFTKQACMRRRRERSEQSKQLTSLFLGLFLFMI